MPLFILNSHLPFTFIEPLTKFLQDLKQNNQLNLRDPSDEEKERGTKKRKSIQSGIEQEDFKKVKNDPNSADSDKMIHIPKYSEEKDL